MDKKVIMIIGGGQLKGLGASIKAVDQDNVGADDLVGGILNAAGTVLISLALGNVASQVKAVTMIRDVADEWLQNNAAIETTPIDIGTLRTGQL